jgi:hypothetical protein
MRLAGYVAHTWEMRNVYRILFKQFLVMRSLGKHWHKCEDSIKMVLREIVSELVAGFK